MDETIEELKRCKICDEEKPTRCFGKNGKWFQPYCKPCDAERKKEYYKKNKEKTRLHQKEYYIQNSEKLKKKANDYRVTEFKKVSERKKKYYQENKPKIEVWRKQYEFTNRERLSDERKAKRVHRKEKIRNYNRHKCNTDIEFRLLKNIRNRIRWALKNANVCKSQKTENLLGCSIPSFKIYFCSLFTDGMTWDLFMAGEIHIDHIKPCKLFDLSMTEQQQKCFHYTNLQPLWKLDNLTKGVQYKEKAA